jgi:hypothetical protein
LTTSVPFREGERIEAAQCHRSVRFVGEEDERSNVKNSEFLLR